VDLSAWRRTTSGLAGKQCAENLISLGEDHSPRWVAGPARAEVANVLARRLSGRRDAAGLPPQGVRPDRNYRETTRCRATGAATGHPTYRQVPGRPPGPRLRLARQRPGARAVRPERGDPRRVPPAASPGPRRRRRDHRRDPFRLASADALLRRYCTLVFARTGSYQETARRLGLDRRTVKDKVDPAWLDRLRSDGHPLDRVSDDEADGRGPAR
jgi:hypothetical protein